MYVFFVTDLQVSEGGPDWRGIVGKVRSRVDFERDETFTHSGGSRYVGHQEIFVRTRTKAKMRDVMRVLKDETAIIDTIQEGMDKVRESNY